MKEQLENLKKKCNLRQAKMCDNCAYFRNYYMKSGKRDYHYPEVCVNPKNGRIVADNGDEGCFEVYGYNVCDNWHDTDGNGNPLRDIVRIEAEPRYPEDAEVNDVREDNDNPKMPFLEKQENSQEGWCWKLDIDIATGEIIGWPKEVKAQVHYKVCDCCRVKYDGKEYYEYVPDFLAIDDEGYGDYIKLTIEDGKIKDWNEDACRRFLKNMSMGDDE